MGIAVFYTTIRLTIMKQLLTLGLACLLLTACKKDSEKTEDTEITAENTPALTFENKEYSQKSNLPCRGENCTTVNISVPVATEGVVGDSINRKVFNVTRSIVYFGEEPSNSTNYNELMASFIKSYDELAKEFPSDAMPWEAKIKATVDYKTDSIIGIKLNNYVYTGGAHGYEGNRSLLFNAVTGRSLAYSDIFKDEKAFTAYAEKKFREKFKIPANKSINATGLFFENDKFVLPLNIFFKENGLLLYYNSVEVGSFADGPKELLLPYTDIDQYMRLK